MQPHKSASTRKNTPCSREKSYTGAAFSAKKARTQTAAVSNGSSNHAGNGYHAPGLANGTPLPPTHRPSLIGAAPPSLGPTRARPVIPCLDSEDFQPGLIHGAQIKYTDSSALKLRRRAYVSWDAGPQQVLIVKKPQDDPASVKLKEIGAWLERKGLQVFVEPVVQHAECPQFAVYEKGETQVDLCITLGGDGTVLYLASLFDQDEPLPPVFCFALGTLGFLTPFDVREFEVTLSRIFNSSEEPLYCTLRTRKRCEVEFEGELLHVHHVLNECVVDRGAFPGAVTLELYVDESFVTSADADGLIIATPTGSTAYSMSSGGPMVAPSVPCTVITPTAPHSLSFRPLLIPETSSITLHLPHNARSYARASFDGKHPARVRRGSSIHFTTSLFPLPLINMGALDVDWYTGITQKIRWNQGIRNPWNHMPAHARAHMQAKSEPVQAFDLP